ncbi:MAG: hypothetical protein WAM60_15540, partial [Candidatus Promineifilaceae bacterium]
AAAYVSAPYIMFVDPHARGDLAESLSFSFFALALWFVTRLYERPNRLNWIGATVFAAAVILVHNLMAMVFFAMLVAWVVWLFFNAEGQRDRGLERRKRFVWLLGALGLGVGLAAIFWLPVALEQGDINLSSLIGPGSHFDFRNHFLSLRELLALPKLLDWGATEPDFSLNLGVGQWLLGVVGLVVLLAGKAKAAWRAGYFALMAVVVLFLMLPISAVVWEKLPYLPYLQFPWRFLGTAAAVLAVLAGVATEWLVRMLPRNAVPYVAGGLIAAVLLPALPLLEVPPWPDDFGPTDMRRVAEVELSGRWLGTTSTADFVPATIEVLPRPQQFLIDDLVADQPPDRVNRATLPEGTEVATEEVTPLHHRYYSTGDKDYLLRLFLFDFPGWEAKIDGEPVTIELARPEGFIIVPVPAGVHTVDVQFGNTPVRLAAALISGLSLVGLGVVGWRMGNDSNAEAQRGRGAKDLVSVEGRPIWVVSGAVLLVLGVYALVLSPSGVLRHQSGNFVAESAEYKTNENFGDQIALIGYDIPDMLEPGEKLDVTFYWQAQQQVTINYQVFVHLMAEDGTLVTQSDKLNPGDFPTKRWPLDKYVRDEHFLTIPADLAPGTYTLSVGLWVEAEGWRLPLLDDNHSQIGDNFIVKVWQVEVDS